jgi:hypothetical protein
VAGVRRGYWLARGPDAAGPLLVVLYRIEGGGHGWPGGPRYLPAGSSAPSPRHLDATGILLEMVTGDRRLLSRAGVSGGAAVPSGLEKRLTATTEALMMAAGEPAEAGCA